MSNVTWTNKKLGDITKLKYGKEKASRNRVGGDIPVYGSGGINGYHNEPLVKEDCIIIGRKGSIGSTYFAEGGCWPIDTVFYTLGSEDVDLKYLYFMIRYLPFQNMDTVKPGLNITFAESLDVRIPNIEYQKKIVKKINFLEQKTKIIDLQEERIINLILKLYEYYFLDFKILKKDEQKTVRKGRLKTLVPTMWEVENFLVNPLFKIVKNTVTSFEGEKKYISTRDIENGSINGYEFTDYKNKKSRANLYVEKNSILFAKMIKTVKHYFFMDNCEEIIDNCIFSTGFFNIVPIEDAFEYVTAATMHEHFENRKDFVGYAKSTQQAINEDELKLIDLVIPDTKSLLKFKKITNPFFSKLEILRNEKMKIKEIQERITQPLIFGNLLVE
tara:strand:+ start:2099 stop:3259 length:1161 start_codon:yes stop_codon:yes gene_type:complete